MAPTKRCHYSTAFKRKFVLHAEKTSNLQAQHKFGVHEKNVRRWRKQRAELFSWAATHMVFTVPRTGRHYEVEEVVADFIREQREVGMPGTTEIIQAKAREVANVKVVTRANFKASRGWATCFTKWFRFSLGRQTSVCRKLPADFEEKLVKFQCYVIVERWEKGYQVEQIAKSDQTPVFFDMPTAYTANKKGAKEVKLRTAGYEKQRTTVMLCCTADRRKLPPYVIFKCKTLPVGKKFPRNVVRVHNKGWMSSGLMEDWVKTAWECCPGAALCKQSLLVLDSYRIHLTDSVKTMLSRAVTDIAIVPGGMTSQLQLLDVAVNKPFKDRLRKHYTDWLTSEEPQLTPTGCIKRALLSQLVNWIAAARNEIPDETIIRAFKKCAISNAMERSEDDARWNELCNKEGSDDLDDDDDDE